MPRQPKPEKPAPKGKATAKSLTASQADNIFGPPGRPQPPLATTFILIHRFESPSGASPWATRADLQALEERIMSKVSDALDRLEAKAADAKKSADDALARSVQFATDTNTKIATMQAEIDDLKSRESLTPAEEARLAALEQGVDALKGTTDQIDPTNPATT